MKGKANVKKKLGRPSKFNQETADIFCYLITTGYSLVEICKLDEMPGYRTVMTWFADEKAASECYT